MIGREQLFSRRPLGVHKESSDGVVSILTWTSRPEFSVLLSLSILLSLEESLHELCIEFARAKFLVGEDALV